MVEFKAIISNPKDGKTFQTIVTGHHANSLIGKQIGDEFDGIFVSLPGYKLILTGGSDKDGVPMRKDLPGPRRKKILISQSIGFHPTRHGMRRRKTMRGNTISPDISQINMKITHFGPKKLADLIPKLIEKKEE